MEFYSAIDSNLGCFYGLKVHALMSGSGIPAEIVLSHGSCSDISAFHGFSLQLPEGSVIPDDKSYNDYFLEWHPDGIRCSYDAGQKENLKKKIWQFIENSIKFTKKYIKSVFIVIKQRFPEHIHAVIHQGFELKVLLFVL